MNVREGPNGIQTPVEREPYGNGRAQNQHLRIGHLNDPHSSSWSVVPDARTTFHKMLSTEFKEDVLCLRRVPTRLVLLEWLSDEENEALLALTNRVMRMR